MGHVPNINNRPSVREELGQAPAPEVLGVINPALPANEPPPPWELDPGSEFAASDARRFVEVPATWELRWINPRILDQVGWRYWEPVMASDSRVKVKVLTMVSPEGNIRRGGQGGDILAWMYKSWVQSRRDEHAAASARLKQSSPDRMEHLKEEFKRGTYGQVALTEARHPTHTMVEGRSLPKD